MGRGGLREIFGTGAAEGTGGGAATAWGELLGYMLGYILIEEAGEALVVEDGGGGG